jgi:hypothetical protein
VAKMLLVRLFIDPDSLQGGATRRVGFFLALFPSSFHYRNSHNHGDSVFTQGSSSVVSFHVSCHTIAVSYEVLDGVLFLGVGT